MKYRVKQAVQANYKALVSVRKAKHSTEKEEALKIKERTQDRAHRLLFGGSV